MPETSAYRSGHMVRYRKVGAKNLNIGSKKSGKSDGLKCFSRNKGKGWINCKMSGLCGRKSRNIGGSHPACRPTMAQCESATGKAATRKKRLS